MTARVFVAIIPGKKYDRIQKYFEIYRSGLDYVTTEYIKEMEDVKKCLICPWKI